MWPDLHGTAPGIPSWPPTRFSRVGSLSTPCTHTPPTSAPRTPDTQQNSRKNECEHALAQATRHPKNIQGGTDALTSEWCRKGPLGRGCTEPERHRFSCLKGIIWHARTAVCLVPQDRPTLSSRDRGIPSHHPNAKRLLESVI